jgi:hypothetical protein
MVGTSLSRWPSVLLTGRVNVKRTESPTWWPARSVAATGIGGEGGVGSPGAPQPMTRKERKQKKEKSGTKKRTGGLGFAFLIFMFLRD